MHNEELASKSFLVIDDYGDMRSMLRNMLRMFGATVIETCNNGKDAITQLEKGDFDVVLCDYNLGAGKDGQQVLEEAKHRELIGVSTIFVMITAENTREMVFGAMEYSPDSYLAKPFTKETLLARLQKLVVSKSSMAPVEQAVRDKHLDEAIKQLDSLILKKPRNIAELVRYKSELCLLAHKYDQAMAIFEKVLAIREVPWAIMGTGQVHYARGDYEEAREIFQDLIYENEELTSAYDWLAKTLLVMDEPDEAQDILESAVELSPKAILRQQALGDIALRNSNFESAEKAFSQAVQQGRHSVFRSPTTYAKLANSKSNLDAHDAALTVIQQLEKEFGTDKEARLIVKTSESQIFANAGDEENAQKSFKGAEKLFQRLSGKISPDSTMEMVKACVSVDERERGLDILKDTIRNNHDNDELLKEIESLFETQGFEGDAKEMICSTRDEIYQLNNTGVTLTQEGKFDEAAELFTKAATGMPANRVINLNAAKVLIRFMQKKGKTTEYISLSRKYLDRVRKLDGDNPALSKLQESLKGIVDAT